MRAEEPSWMRRSDVLRAAEVPSDPAESRKELPVVAIVDASGDGAAVCKVLSGPLSTKYYDAEVEWRVCAPEDGGQYEAAVYVFSDAGGLSRICASAVEAQVKVGVALGGASWDNEWALDAKVEVVPCGSYRRGKSESGDVDILLTRWDNKPGQNPEP